MKINEANLHHQAMKALLMIPLPPDEGHRPQTNDAPFTMVSRGRRHHFDMRGATMHLALRAPNEFRKAAYSASWPMMIHLPDAMKGAAAIFND